MQTYYKIKTYSSSGGYIIVKYFEKQKDTSFHNYRVIKSFSLPWWKIDDLFSVGEGDDKHSDQITAMTEEEVMLEIL